MYPMGKPLLTEKIAFEALQSFFRRKPFVIFGTGTSMGVDLKFGMGALQSHLESTIPGNGLNTEQRKQWDDVIQDLRKMNPDFEAAMNNVQDSNLLDMIVEETANLISRLDQELAPRILSGEKSWPALKIFKKLVDGLPESDRALHVATPNYDLLAEYSFASTGIPYTTGFWGGVFRKPNWKQSLRGLTYLESHSSRGKKQEYARYHKHIRLYKVHGSLNIFETGSGMIQTDLWIVDKPENTKRMMITPGMSKHKIIHDYRSFLTYEYDTAKVRHDSFLFLGFGFNDDQLVNDKIIEKISKEESWALIITRDSNERIQEVLENSKNAWLVCGDPDDKYESTLVYNREYDDFIKFPGLKLWEFDRFADRILGG